MPDRTRIAHAGRRTTRRGFSLLELMLVLAIIAILMSVAAYNVLGRSNTARITATQSTLNTIKTAIDDYHLQYAAFPPTLNTLITAKILQPKPMKDAWKIDLYYLPQPSGNNPYTLGSAGPDNIMGNEDDISVWEAPK